MVLQTGNGMAEMWNNPFIYLLLFGFIGNGGLGGLGGNGVRQELSNDFLFSNLNADLNALSAGLREGFTGINNGLQNIGKGITDAYIGLGNGIAGVSREILESGYRNDLAVANQTAALVANSNSNTQAILDKLCASEIANLNAKLCDTNAQLAEARTIAAIQAATAPLVKMPVAAYNVCAPFHHPHQ